MNSTTDHIEDGFVNRMLHTGILIDKYYTPLLCLFGALGNSLSLAVFCLDSKYRGQSSSYYLSALAVSDTGFLLNLFAVWLESVLGGVITSNLMCPLVMYLGQVTCFMSVYLTVVFTIERYVAVHYPFSRPRICTTSKAKKGILALASVALLLFSYAWVIAKVIEIKPSMYRKDGKSYQIVDNSTAFDITDTNISIHTFFRDLDADNDLYNKSIRSSNKTPDFPLISVESTTCMDEEDWEEGKQKRTTSTSPNLDYRQMNAHESSKSWLIDDNNKDDRSIKVALTISTAPDAKKKMRFKLDYFHLIDDDTIMEVKQMQRQQQRNKRNGLLFSVQDRRVDNDNSDWLATKPQQISVQLSTTTPNLSTELRRNYRCTVPEHYHKISEIANYLDTIVTLIIPLLVITYLNIRISLSVWKLKDQRQQIVASPSIHMNKQTRMMVIGNPSRNRKHPPLTKVVNTECHQNHTHNFGDGMSEKRAGVRFKEDISPVICHPRNYPLRRNIAETGLNEIHQVAFDAAEPRIQMGGNDRVMKHDVSIFHRGEQRAVFHSHHPSSEVRVTKTLLLVSTMFVVLNLPLHVIRCAQFLQSVTGTREGKEILRALQPWASLLFNANFAVNFFLYCASGRNFRKSLRHIVSRLLRNTPPRPNPKSYCSPHHNNHYDNRQYGQNCVNRRIWKWKRNSTPERTETRNISSCCCDHKIPTAVEGAQATEFLDLENIRSVVRIEESSIMCLTDKGNEESKAV